MVIKLIESKLTVLVRYRYICTIDGKENMEEMIVGNDSWLRDELDALEQVR